MLFRIAFFVEGKHLEKVLSAVSGVALNMEAPQPVMNAAPAKGGKVKQISEETSMHGRLAELLKKHKGKEVTTAQLKHFVEELGGSPISYNHFAKMMVDQKVLKRKGRGLFTAI